MPQSDSSEYSGSPLSSSSSFWGFNIHSPASTMASSTNSSQNNLVDIPHLALPPPLLGTVAPHGTPATGTPARSSTNSRRPSRQPSLSSTNLNPSSTSTGRSKSAPPAKLGSPDTGKKTLRRKKSI